METTETKTLLPEDNMNHEALTTRLRAKNKITYSAIHLEYGAEAIEFRGPTINLLGLIIAETNGIQVLKRIKTDELIKDFCSRVYFF